MLTAGDQYKIIYNILNMRSLYNKIINKTGKQFVSKNINIFIKIIEMNAYNQIQKQLINQEQN